MLNTSAAQLVTLDLSGESITGDVVEISAITTTDAGMTADVTLADGRTLKGVDAIDITAIPGHLLAAAA
ncbi:hypothetical protein [Prescottella equi]|uniref:hypothetical protein n=1 Tax=Rhodococcus hoagii TaxID=43767 RepID=UPI0038507A81